MPDENKGLETLRATAARIKSEVVASNQAAIVAAKLSDEAMEYLNRHSATGAEDLNTGVSVPQLRIHSVGISAKNELADGSEPKDGQIFYTGDQTAYDKVTVILLSIKKCRLEQEDEKTGEKYMKANYLLAGLIDETLQPFVMYVKGMSYNKIWLLEDQLKPYVTKRAGGIPLSMLKIVVSSEKEKVEQGDYKGQKKNVFKFELLMHESGEFPILEGDGEKLRMLDSSTEKAENMLDQIVASKGMTEKEWLQQKKDGQRMSQAVQTNVIDAEEAETPPDNFETTEAEDVADDIPF